MEGISGMSILGSLLGGGLLTPILKTVDKVLDRVIPDQVERDKVRSAIQTEVLKNEGEIAKAASAVLVAEATGHSWLQRNWRPMLMVLIMILLVWNGVLVPLIYGLFGVNLMEMQPWQAIPPQMWNLLIIGLGGYVAGRSGEKMVKTWVEGKRA